MIMEKKKENAVMPEMVVKQPAVKNESNRFCMHENMFHFEKCEFWKTEFCNADCIWHKDHKREV